MGFFSNPKCSQCGREVVETGYSFPYPQYRCNFCMRDNHEKRELEKRITALEKTIEEK